MIAANLPILYLPHGHIQGANRSNHHGHFAGSEEIPIRTFESDTFGNTPMPSSFAELLKTIHKPLWETDMWRVLMWRGQADIRWPVHSSAYRRLVRDEANVTENDIQYYEKTLLERATHRGFRFQEGRRLHDFELLARLQHHGAATRLVDFTRSAMVGLYFACASHPKEVGLLLGLHTRFMGGYEGEPEVRPYTEVVSGLAKYEHPQTWEPPVVSPRIAAQHAQFLYSAVSSDRKGSLFIHKSERAYLAIAISPRLKQIVLKELSEVYDIRHQTLFPDLDGFGFENSPAFGQFEGNRW